MGRPLTKIATIAAVMGLVLAAVGPVAAAGTTAGNTAGNDGLGGAGNQALSIGVQQGGGSATVAVSYNGSAVENASVDVTGDSSYNGTGSYTTGAAGTVRLPLPGPNESVTVDIDAEKDGLTGSTTVTLHGTAGQGPAFGPPGQSIAAFVHALQSQDGIARMGLFVSSYVHSLGPSAQARSNGGGPPAWSGAADKGPSTKKSADRGDRGPPDHAINRSEKGPDGKHGGPPGHAKKGGDDDEDGNGGNGPQGKARGHNK